MFLVRIFVKFALVSAIVLMYPLSAYGAFLDTEAHVYTEAIQFLQDKGVVQGYSDNTFRPDNLVNRAEFLKMVMELKEWSIENEHEGIFHDVDSADWFAPYVHSAAKNNLVNGYPDGFFRPEQNINFAEASKIITKAFRYNTNSSEEKRWYEPYVIRLSNKHAIPDSIDSFWKNITRGEIAELIWRMSVDHTRNDYHTYGDILKLEHQAEYDLDPVAFAQKLVDENNALPNPENRVGWVDDEVRIEIETLVKRSALFDSELLINHACMRMYRDVLYFTAPVGQSFFVKEFDRETLQTVPALEFDDANCAKVFKDKNGVYIFKSDDPNLFIIANVADADSFEGMKKEGFYRDKENVYLLVNDSLKQVNGTGIDFKKLSGIPLLDNVTKKMLAEAHSCFGGNICSRRVARFSHHTLYRNEDMIYLFDGSSFIPHVGIDAKSFEKIKGPDDELMIEMGIVFFHDANLLYRLKDNKLEALPKLDASTFEIKLVSRERILGQDKSSLYVESQDDSYTIDLAVYEEIDTPVRSSNRFNKGWTQAYYAHDNEHVYRISYKGSVPSAVIVDRGVPILLEDMNPETFEVHALEYGFPTEQEYFIYGSNDGQFWLYDEKGENETILDDVDAETFEIIDWVEFREHIEAGIQEEPFYYTDPGVCSIIQKDFKNGPRVFEDRTEKFERLPDGTCYLINERFSEAYYKYNEGFVGKDKDTVWTYSNDAYELERDENLDGASFEQVLHYDIFKDKNGVYFMADNDFTKLQDADPLAFEVQPFRGMLYAKDKDNVWVVEAGLQTFKKLQDVDLEHFFDREPLAAPDAKRIIVTLNDIEGSDGAMMLDLATGELTQVTDDMTEFDVLNTYSSHFFIQPGDPELGIPQGSVTIVQEEFSEIDNSLLKDFIFTDSERLSRDDIKEGTVFVVKTEYGDVYKMKIMDFFEDTYEIVLDYIPIEE
ncbi:MAG: DKNYY domain-containing protein [Patescibacteria group bacterium]